jgi:Sulfotransferase family
MSAQPTAAAGSGLDVTANPIFIIGTERSGSNLLRLVLNTHPNIAIPHPPHLMRYLAPIAHRYGDLTVESNRRRLVRDALTLVRRHISPWPYQPDEGTVTAQASPTLFGVVATIYEHYRRAEGKPRWGCKSTFMVEHVDEVLAHYPRAAFIWLVRDPRDVAASAKRSVFGFCHPYLTANLWAAQQRVALAALDRHGTGVVHLLRYEELVSRPEQAIAGVCQFLDEPMIPEMLQPDRSPAARDIAGRSESWRNAAEPINSGSLGSHQTRLTTKERDLVEGVTGELMRLIGYTPRSPANVAAPARLRVRVDELRLRALVEFRSARRDRNVVRRWVRDATVRRLRVRTRLRLIAQGS